MEDRKIQRHSYGKRVKVAEKREQMILPLDNKKLTGGVPRLVLSANLFIGGNCEIIYIYYI